MLHRESRLLRGILSLYLKMASRGRYVLLVDFVSLVFAVYLGYSLRVTFFIEQGYAGELLQTICIFSL